MVFDLMLYMASAKFDRYILTLNKSLRVDPRCIPP